MEKEIEKIRKAAEVDSKRGNEENSDMLRNTEAKGFKNFLDKDNELEVMNTELRDEVRSLKKKVKSLENMTFVTTKGKFIISLVLNNYFTNDG